MKVAVIGGGAAGFFSAIIAKENHPSAQVVLFEKSKKILSKVKISGGGRCNVTNACSNNTELSKAYPRGGKKLKKAFRKFNTLDTIKWFEDRGVPLITEEDQRIFPASNDSQTIIDCFLKQAKKLGIRVEIGVGIKSIEALEEQIKLYFIKEIQPPQTFDKVIVATGGSPKRKGLEWLEQLGHKIVDPVPSLFTFNMPDESITDLMGVAVENAMVSIPGTKLKSNGPLLITHWGMSGPAVLKLSAFGARILHDLNYTHPVNVNWANTQNDEIVRAYLQDVIASHPKKILANFRPYALPERLWLFLLTKGGLPKDKRWNELGKKGLNKLTHMLTNDEYKVQGKTTFKEEFVTCGGVSLDSIDFNTMQSKVCRNLYFAGEVMDIDAITGGYNFQAAWTTAFIAGKLE